MLKKKLSIYPHFHSRQQTEDCLLSCWSPNITELVPHPSLFPLPSGYKPQYLCVYALCTRMWTTLKSWGLFYTRISKTNNQEGPLVRTTAITFTYSSADNISQEHTVRLNPLSSINAKDKADTNTGTRTQTKRAYSNLPHSRYSRMFFSLLSGELLHSSYRQMRISSKVSTLKHCPLLCVGPSRMNCSSCFRRTSPDMAVSLCMGGLF